ncbi:hypothetical protein [Rhizobium sp. FY34]|uniref:hypothetical protein n=1 Tax=Rhizobium sp. FY34 TaxID=2562309 RepID=UPI0010BFD897|nr:hypothetical protein [Rhizobium sp. FY34]
MVIGGLVLVGGSGAAALYIGADSLLGPSYEEVNGLECTTLQVVKIKRNDRYWVRKYVFTESGDGLSRLKTALRVAKAVQVAEKADLVQVSVLDKTGPTQRAAMRGRAIGAQVVYIPDTSRAPDPSDPVYSAYYLEGAPSAKGEYFGLRIDPPLEDMTALATGLNDTADCISPVVEGEAKAGGHGDTKGKDAHGKDAGGHGKPDASADKGHGAAPDAHGKEKPEAGVEGDGHGAEGAKNENHDGGDKPAEGGLLSSLTSMVFGAPEPAEAHGDASQAAAHTADATDHTQPSDEHTSVAEKPGIVDRIKGMIFGSDADKVVMDHAPADASGDGKAPANAHNAATPAQDGIDPMKVASPADGKASEPAAPPAKVSH